MADIKIKVENRIATNLTPEVKLVTKNEGYTVEFEFDEIWTVSSLKTALFIANGHCIPVPFTGNVCEIPMVVGIELLNVGVKSNDVLGLQTTTAAKVLYNLSADDLVADEIPAPTQSIYDTIIGMINEGMVKGEKGEKGDKGDKGDAGVIEFIPVTELPTENIKNAVYLLPIENPKEGNRYAEYIYVNGKWEKFGEITLQVVTDIYAKKEEVIEALKNYVTLNTEQDITGAKNFKSPLTVSSSDTEGNQQYTKYGVGKIENQINSSMTEYLFPQDGGTLLTEEKAEEVYTPKGYRHIETITLTEDTHDMTVSKEQSGKAYNFKAVLIRAKAKAETWSGSSPMRFNINGSYVGCNSTAVRADYLVHSMSSFRIEKMQNESSSYWCFADFSSHGSNFMNAGTTQRNAGVDIGSSTIKNIRIYSYNNESPFPAGTIIEIYAIDA